MTNKSIEDDIKDLQSQIRWVKYNEPPDLPDPPEAPAEREYRLWREYCDDYDFSAEELHEESQESREINE
jgi:hypothetical protein